MAAQSAGKWVAQTAVWKAELKVESSVVWTAASKAGLTAASLVVSTVVHWGQKLVVLLAVQKAVRRAAQSARQMVECLAE